MIARWMMAVVAVTMLVSCSWTSLSVAAQPANGSPAATPTALPDTPVGRQVGWVLDILAGEAQALTEAEITARFAPGFLAMLPPAQALATIQQIAAVYGPVILDGFVRPPTETQALALVTAESGETFLAIVAVEGAEPHRLTTLSFQPAPAGLKEATAAGGAFGGLVDVGGRRLYLSCLGPAFAAGGPTVILEAGHGNDSTVWLAVQAALAPDIRTCAYDRANTPGGASDPVATPRTGQEVIADLNGLLSAAEVPGPYVLVGHSLGGLFVRLYASVHPEQVAGLVLVDASHEDQDARLRELVGPELWAATEAEAAGFVDAEGFDFDAIGAEVRAARAAAPLPPMPLVVLTHGLPADAATLPPGWPVAEEEHLWRELHADLAGLVPGGRQIVAERSGHYIQNDEPELVVAAIREVVAASAGGSATPLATATP